MSMFSVEGSLSVVLLELLTGSSAGCEFSVGVSTVVISVVSSMVISVVYSGTLEGSGTLDSTLGVVHVETAASCSFI